MEGERGRLPKKKVYQPSKGVAAFKEPDLHKKEVTAVSWRVPLA
jgi:hypothetical protein